MALTKSSSETHMELQPRLHLLFFGFQPPVSRIRALNQWLSRFCVLGFGFQISLHGGQVISWRNDQGEELLFTSNKVCRTQNPQTYSKEEEEDEDREKSDFY